MAADYVDVAGPGLQVSTPAAAQCVCGHMRLIHGGSWLPDGADTTGCFRAADGTCDCTTFRPALPPSGSVA